jgi:hypothetical protein
MDICFTNPQDLLALPIAICVWHLDKVKRLSRSAIRKEYSSHRQTGRRGDKTPESKASADDGTWTRSDNLPAHMGWKVKKKKRGISQKLKIARHFTKENVFTKA